jgi:hypothetical protein
MARAYVRTTRLFRLGDVLSPDFHIVVKTFLHVLASAW